MCLVCKKIINSNNKKQQLGFIFFRHFLNVPTSLPQKQVNEPTNQTSQKTKTNYFIKKQSVSLLLFYILKPKKPKMVSKSLVKRYV